MAVAEVAHEEGRALWNHGGMALLCMRRSWPGFRVLNS
jgi:hypothetical protein